MSPDKLSSPHAQATQYLPAPKRCGRFFFLHIPKTAGSSLHRLLEQTTGPYLHLQRPHELHWPATAIWRRFRGCGGHVGWAQAQLGGYLDEFSLTFLRDPIDRVLSQYAYSQDDSHGDKPDAVLVRHFGLKRLLKHSMGRFGPFWNVQTFMLSGLNDPKAGPEGHLESALANLETFNFVGTLENFTEDCHKLLALLGGVRDNEIPRENQTKNRQAREGLDSETLDLLEESQALDQILYARAKELKNRTVMGSLSRESIILKGWPEPPTTSGNLDAQITLVEVRATSGGELSPGMEVEIIVHWNSTKTVNDVILGFSIEDVVGNLISASNTFLLTQRYFSIQPGPASGIFKFVATMGAGRYAVNAAIHHDHQDICFVRSAAIFEVATPVTPYREGMVDILARSYLAPNPHRRELPETAAKRISLNVEALPSAGLIAKAFHLTVRLVNESTCVLSSDEDGQVFLSYHWRSMEHTPEVCDGLRSSLPHAVWPNEAAEFGVRVLPPPSVGQWCLQLRVLQEGVRWHEGPGYEKAMPADLLFDYRADGELTLLTRP